MRLNALATLPLALLLALALGACSATSSPDPEPPPDLDLLAASVTYVESIDALVFEQRVRGEAGATVPTPVGGLDGAPVLGYVFPTTLSPTAVGFGDVAGTLALALTSHPDFDDTPLWDEDGDGDYDNDGAIYHSHWVVLVPDERAPAGLAVKQADGDSVLPPTAPMAMYLDSPGFPVVLDGDRIRVTVPLDRVRGHRDFSFDAVTAYMEVEMTGGGHLLAVHDVYDVLSGDLSAPYPVQVQQGRLGRDAGVGDPFELDEVSVRYVPELDGFLFRQRVTGAAASVMPEPAGQLDGAPVLSYTWLTTLSPTDVGFGDVDGTVALAVTSHPDFDDTPLWDESGDGDYDNDGGIYHTHWVVLVPDEDAPGGLAARPAEQGAILPPTAPMQMYLDSPGFSVAVDGDTVQVFVPRQFLRGRASFDFDAVTAALRVDASGPMPRLLLEEILDGLDGGAVEALPRGEVFHGSR
jgi:hypothetical protein